MGRPAAWFIFSFFAMLLVQQLGKAAMTTHNVSQMGGMPTGPASSRLSPLVMMDATDLAAQIRTRQVSCREVMEAYLDHIDRYNPAVNAIISLVDRETSITAAEAADGEIAKGDYRGPMHGLPHAVKDLAFTKGIRTTLGSPLFDTPQPIIDALFVERLRAAGAILIGKTNVPELGLGSHTYNSIFGTTLNAYDQSKSAGGSSGGAAVGLAMRMLPVADGSDFGGSLRNPAGWNNVFGFRPSAGRVPQWPAPDLFLQQLGYDGPMARTVTDLAMLLQVMAGYDDRAPLSLSEDPNQFAGALQRDMRGIRIGWLGDQGGIPMEAGMLDLCLGGLKRLEEIGCVVEDARLKIDCNVIWDTFVKLRQGLTAGRFNEIYQNPIKREKLKPAALWEIENGQKLSAVDFYAASTQRSAVYQAYRSLFQTYDFLAMPSAQVFPFDATLHWPTEIAGVAMDSYHRWMEIVVGPSLVGCPTVCVPAGFSPEGLPTGIQIVGPARQDFSVLQLAYAYEQASKPAIARLPNLLQEPS